MSNKEIEQQETFGPNIWLVDEMYRQYQESPQSVGESWREFFEDYQPQRVGQEGTGATAKATAARPDKARSAPEQPPPARKPEPEPDESAPEDAAPLRGIAAKIAENMEASLEVPTATSVRTVPAKLLEENRRTINRYLAATKSGKVSFTHIIGWAILKALEARPAMKASYASVNGKPHVVVPKHVNFGLAVDLERSGQRILIVPNIKEADELDFAGFWNAYENLIHKVKTNSLAPDDYSGTTITLTNPGTVGTTQSVPRLVKGQGLIVGTGAITYPGEFEASDPKMIARMGVAKVITVTSTYDHRVIQGAESGQFLALVHDLLQGTNRFYDELFASLKIPYEPVRWSRDFAAFDDVDATLEKQSRVMQLINMYRVRGHLIAELNPIGWEVLHHPELDLSHYGLTLWDLDREFLTDGLPGPRKQTLRKIIDILRDSYSRTIGVEYMHMAEPVEKRWIQERVEGKLEDLPKEEKIHILDRIGAAEAFERFLHSKYTGNKRFSLEGAESTIAMLDALIERAADEEHIEVIMGMSHRGRLNVLANIVGKPPKEIFREFEGEIDPDTVQGSGDVKYHLGMTGRFTSRAGNDIAVVLASNPSHLEAVDPVVEGMARAKQDLLGDDSTGRVLPLLLHGDAAFAGQGVVAETFNLSQLRGYQTGGTVHLVVNNLIGFTTAPHAGRSSTYATDIAKMVQCPIFHVNGDDPEACVRVTRLAYEYRKHFKKDVVIDLVCYRKYGHNEADEPAFTQPLMYAKIDERRSVRKLYTEQLLNAGEITVEEAEDALDQFRARLKEAFEETRESKLPEPVVAQPPKVVGVLPAVETGAEAARLEHVHEVLTSFPQGFEPHPKLKKMIEKRASILEQDAIDWAHGEALAFGSLLMEGTDVRLSGQDSRRGTFSQRHSVLVDYRTGEEYTPLNDLSSNQARFRCFDSLLSEYAAMGFDYGYSVANGDALVCWEAQFGDFVNGGQIVVDQFISSGEDKWEQESGLVLLLPHGFEGQGPEHSSARLERFLTLCAEDNMQVAQPTTPAQYFHLLRRQMHRSVRKPLIVMTPKSLLRNPDARSKFADFTSGHFIETLDDTRISDREAIKRVVLCTGKIGLTLMNQRDERAADVAIVRVEQLYPFPKGQIYEILDRYPNAKEVLWVQDEPENMGAWWFVYGNIRADLPERFKLRRAARAESGSPATGSPTVHEQEGSELLDKALTV
ncbi:MAG: multifunctional oxoglutarate decarboxylase/oxoglutarate dehydrogenase thiamine pyrophosphate-binding subunit/dihydrolipoyllysine-residue succinyltransferase subunit [Actinomycetota bacterium]